MKLPSISDSLHNLREIFGAFLVLVVLPVSFAIKYLRFLCAHQELVAQTLLLRRQLGLFLERKKRPRRANKATRLVMVLLSRLCDWKDALVVVKPETLIRWHRQGFKLLLRWKSRPGRLPISDTARWLIAKKGESSLERGANRFRALIPMIDTHLRMIVMEWVEHYNRGRPHSSLGPGLPDPPVGLPVARQTQRHHLPDGATVNHRSVLGGLHHHEYQLDLAA